LAYSKQNKTKSRKVKQKSHCELKEIMEISNKQCLDFILLQMSSKSYCIYSLYLTIQMCWCRRLVELMTFRFN